MKKSPVLKYILISTAVFLVVIGVLMRDNIFRWIGAEVTLHRQKKQIEYYQKENAALDERIQSLSTDRDSLEKYAREKFLFAEPGDDVYLTGDE